MYRRIKKAKANPLYQAIWIVLICGIYLFFSGIGSMSDLPFIRRLLWMIAALVTVFILHEGFHALAAKCLCNGKVTVEIAKDPLGIPSLRTLFPAPRKKSYRVIIFLFPFVALTVIPTLIILWFKPIFYLFLVAMINACGAWYDLIDTLLLLTEPPVAFVWDLDGTLIDSYDVIVDGLVASLNYEGITVPREKVLEEIKKTSMSAYLAELRKNRSFSPEAVHEHYTVYTHAMEDRIRLVPGAGETLKALQKAGIKHYVYTHRGSSTHRILERLGILAFFEDIVTSEAHFAPKPAPDGLIYLIEKHGLDPERTWYVGDRNLDVACGRNAGAHSILYLEEGSYVQPDGTENRIIFHLTDLTDFNP